MTTVTKLSDGTTDIDLYFDSSGLEMKIDGSDFGIADHDNTMHKPVDRDGESVVRHRLENIEWPLSFAVKGTDNDAVIDNVNALGKLAEQARRYEILEDVDKVYLQIQLDGCTNWTRFDVKDVLYDEIAAFNYYNIASSKLEHNEGFSVNVLTHPTGYGDTVTLKNEIRTPGFREDHDSDGLASNWSKVNGAETTSLNTTNYLVGTQSQQVIVGIPGDRGIQSDVASFGTLYRGESFVAYAWVYRSAGTDEIAMQVIGDINGSRGSTTYSVSTAITATDADGKTWRKMVVSGTLGGADNSVYIRIYRTSGSIATTFCVDKVYLQFNTSYTPTEWTSSAYTSNHYDSTSEGLIPYIDIYGIRGDRPTNPDIWVRAADANTSVKFLKFTNSAVNKIEELDYYLQFGGIGGQADRSGLAYDPETVTSVAWKKAGGVDLSVSEVDSWVGEVLLMSSMMTADTDDLKVRGNFKFASEDYEDNLSEVLYTVESEWRLVTSGPIVTPSLGYSTVNGLAAMEMQFADSATATVNVDFALFAPISDGSVFVELTDTLVSNKAFLLNNERRQAYTTSYTAGPGWVETVVVLGRIVNGILGRDIRLIPERANKMFILGTAANNVHVATDGNIETTIEYRPRTRFLLGDA